jgi:predicted ArsR family transcriptional regulator
MAGDAKDAAGLEAELAGIAALADPVRRRLYLHVVEAGEASREQAARALRIGRALAAFHLDRLVDEGLLEADYRRLTGRRGPGAGRPAKVYRRSTRELGVTLPARRYELMARLLLRAAEGFDRPEEQLAAARKQGVALGAEARRQVGHRGGREAAQQGLVNLLDRLGFQPFRDGEVIRLRNCPFDSLARDHRDLVCGMNLELMRGVVAGLGSPGPRALPERAPGICCVAFRHSTGKSGMSTL